MRGGGGRSGLGARLETAGGGGAGEEGGEAGAESSVVVSLMGWRGWIIDRSGWLFGVGVSGRSGAHGGTRLREVGAWDAGVGRDVSRGRVREGIWLWGETLLVIDRYGSGIVEVAGPWLGEGRVVKTLVGGGHDGIALALTLVVFFLTAVACIRGLFDGILIQIQAMLSPFSTSCKRAQLDLRVAGDKGVATVAVGVSDGDRGGTRGYLDPRFYTIIY